MTNLIEHEVILNENEKINYKNLWAHQTQFNFEKTSLYWRDNSPIKTFYDNAFSMIVPLFEEFMIENIKPYIPQFKGRFQEDIICFCTQEYNHAINHSKFNRWLSSQNIPIKDFNARVEKLISKYQTIPATKKLQLIALIETFTAVMAKFYLINAQADKVDPEIERLLIWHAIEELEHRCVAFQVHSNVNGKHTRNYFFIMLFCFRVAILLLKMTFKQIIVTKSFFKKRTWKDIFWLFNNKGPNLMILRGMFNFMRPTYNPANYFNEKILNERVREWEKRLHQENKLTNKFHAPEKEEQTF